MKRFLRIALTTFTMCATMTLSVYAGTWQDQGGKWKYANDDGTYATAQWVQDQDKWYYVDAEGFMKIGWFQDTNGAWYYLDSSGAMLTSVTQKIDGTDYTFDASGVWAQPAAPQQSAALSDGWNGKTYVNRKMDYQITFSDAYVTDAAGTGETVVMDGATIEFMAGHESGSVWVAFTRYEMPEIQQFDLTASQYALMMKDVYGVTSQVTTVTLGECEFSKITLMESNEMVMDLYFRRVGPAMTMIESIYIPGSAAEAANALSTIRHAPQ